jgi:hypothetical protein
MTCAVRDAPFTEAELTSLAPEVKLDLLQLTIDHLYLDESRHHDVPETEWNTAFYIMCDAPALLVCKDGKKTLETVCTLLHLHYQNHAPRSITDDNKLEIIRKWVANYGLSLDLKYNQGKTA